MNSLLTLSEASRLINSGRALAVAGSSRALHALPRGNWIGGTSHYFIGPVGGVHSHDQVFVTDLSALGTVVFQSYGTETVNRIAPDTPDTGFSFVIIPAGSATLEAFANRPYTSDLFLKPVVGWISGVDLESTSAEAASVVDGRTASWHPNAAVVAHVTLPPGKLASISIIDPFEPATAHVLRFATSGFSATECTVDGKTQALASFLEANAYADGHLPLIGNFSGAQVNVSIRRVDPASRLVEFYAPVFSGVDYRLAKPTEGFAERFAAKIAARDTTNVVFSCNCILNYVHGRMEGKRTGHLLGPVTFGEIAYQLLNQTLVLLEIV
jgi:hypothetical protein